MTWVSTFLLFILLFLNTLSVTETDLFTKLRRHWAEILGAQVVLFLWFPLVVAAAAVLLLRDHDFAFGLVVSSLAPSALVNPFFAQRRGGDPGLTLVNVLLSTLLCSILTLPVLKLLGFDAVFIEPRTLGLYLSVLTIFPLVLSVISSRIYPPLRALFAPYLALGNSVVLGILMFILVGSSLNRIPLRLLLNQDLAMLFALYIAMDFGFFILARAASLRFTDLRGAETIALSVGARNFAISAGLMLFFHPKAALPSAVGLIVHSLFFEWLLFIKKNDCNNRVLM